MRPVLDGTPHPQAIFDREDNEREKFDDRKGGGVARFIFRDGFEGHRD